MDEGLVPLMGLMTLVEGVLQLLIALIPLAIWQRTRQQGYALIAAGFALSGALQLLSMLLFSFGSGFPSGLFVAWRLLGFGSMLLIAFGFWQVYGAYRQPKPATPAEG